MSETYRVQSKSIRIQTNSADAGSSRVACRLVDELALNYLLEMNSDGDRCSVRSCKIK